jgi:hypothetical protein
MEEAADKENQWPNLLERHPTKKGFGNGEGLPPTSPLPYKKAGGALRCVPGPVNWPKGGGELGAEDGAGGDACGLTWGTSATTGDELGGHEDSGGHAQISLENELINERENAKAYKNECRRVTEQGKLLYASFIAKCNRLKDISARLDQSQATLEKKVRK